MKSMLVQETLYGPMLMNGCLQLSRIDEMLQPCSLCNSPCSAAGNSFGKPKVPSRSEPVLCAYAHIRLDYKHRSSMHISLLTRIIYLGLARFTPVIRLSTRLFLIHIPKCLVVVYHDELINHLKGRHILVRVTHVI